MKIQAFFSNTGADCRLCITHPDGHCHHVLFDSVSHLVNYCRCHAISVPMSNCFTED